MRKLPPKTEKELNDIIVRFPTKTDKQIAIETGCNRTTVAKYRKEMDLRYDSEFVSIVAGKFIKAFGRAEEYWLKQIDRLEELKTGTVLIKNETEGSFEKILLSPMEILAIEKHQSELQGKILFLASQGEVREVLRIMRSGKIPMLESE